MSLAQVAQAITLHHFVTLFWWCNVKSRHEKLDLLHKEMHQLTTYKNIILIPSSWWLNRTENNLPNIPNNTSLVSAYIPFQQKLVGRNRLKAEARWGCSQYLMEIGWNNFCFFSPCVYQYQVMVEKLEHLNIKCYSSFLYRNAVFLSYHCGFLRSMLFGL